MLHELAHAVVGDEILTVPWEQAFARRLWGEDSASWKNLLVYEAGAVEEGELDGVLQALLAWPVWDTA